MCTCEADYYGYACEKTCLAENGLMCAGHGECVEDDEGTPVCECDQHFVGQTCSAGCPTGVSVTGQTKVREGICAVGRTARENE